MGSVVTSPKKPFTQLAKISKCVFIFTPFHLEDLMGPDAWTTSKLTQTSKQTYTHSDKQTKKHTHTDKQTNKQTYTHTNKQTKKHTYTDKQRNKQTNKHTHILTNKQTYTHSDKHTHIRTHKQANKQTYTHTDKQLRNFDQTKSASKWLFISVSKLLRIYWTRLCKVAWLASYHKVISIH